VRKHNHCHACMLPFGRHSQADHMPYLLGAVDGQHRWMILSDRHREVRRRLFTDSSYCKIITIFLARKIGRHDLDYIEVA
jgi:hypothetical protein